jgi:hypothetical protein
MAAFAGSGSATPPAFRDGPASAGLFHRRERLERGAE